MGRYWSATGALLRKNARLSVRDSVPLVLALSASFLSLLILYFSQLSFRGGAGFFPELREARAPPAEPLGPVPRCVAENFPDCVSLAYVPGGAEWEEGGGDARAREWVRAVATAANMPEREVKGFKDSASLNSYLVANPNRTQAAYIFENDALAAITDGNVQFIVQYNDTEQMDFPLDTTDFHAAVVVPAMIHAMNRVIMSEVSNKSFNIDLSLAPFPHPNLDGADDAFRSYGPLLIYATYFLCLVLYLNKIVDEKQRGLRDAMKIAGQTQTQHYLSWTIVFAAFMLLISLLIIAFGHAFRFEFFTRTSFPVYFITMISFSVSIVGWTFLLSTIIKRAESVSVVAFNVFIISYIISSFGAIIYVVDDNGKSFIGDNVLYLRELFALLPSTVFIKAMTDTTTLALAGFTLTVSSAGTYTDVFPVRTCWYWMLVSGLVAYVVSIYLDNVVPTDFGTPLHPLYFLKPSYWRPHRSEYDAFTDEPDVNLFGGVVSPDHRPADVTGFDPAVEDEDVRREREAIAIGERDSAVLIVKNISRKFGKFVAVDDVSLSVRRNSALVLLGHNGAGKSTLFKMLTTSLGVTAGDAFIRGHSVRHAQSEVRKFLGVCQQYNIYWDLLTGEEHVELFAALKGIPKEDRAEEIRVRMDDVGLTEFASRRAGAYSGGMLRRLSVAISLTGDPNVLLMDEPTAGSDPLVRRELWGTLERAKKDRVLLLITHSMEEAQVIAGQNAIGIMSKGKLRVHGTALRLKSKFGAGHQALVKLKNADDGIRVEEALSAVCPGIVMKPDHSAVGRPTEDVFAEYVMPRHTGDAEVKLVVKVLEEKKEELGILQYSFNSATLDQVFKSITALSEDVNENEDDNERSCIKKCCCCCVDSPIGF